tara:strand:- start:1353 stop:1694 length:342 start_codon:yes stop_codon:yes gene_type:complete
MQDNKYKYGQEGKKIVFQDSDKRHADLRVRLRHDGLTQIQFFQAMMTGYLENDSRIIDYITDVKLDLSRQGKGRIKKTRDLIESGDDIRGLFNLDEKETEDLFDIIAREMPDL